MARALSSALDAIMLSALRLPAYRVDVYDLRSTRSDVVPTRVSDVVLANLDLGTLPEIVGPREFTDDVVSIEVVEVAGDYAGDGLAASQITLTLVDPSGELDPVENPPTVADPEALGRWLRQGNVVVIREGDVRVDPADWPITFTGKLQGQVGCNRNRTTGAAELTAKASSREADYLRLESTSENFAQGTSFAQIASSLAETDLGLDPEETALPTLVRTTSFATTQFVDESPLASLAKLLFLDDFMPRFDGRGVLTASGQSLTKGPTRTYEDAEAQIEIVRPLIEQTGPNEVQVVGLDPVKSKVAQERQTLATATITTGFFSKGAKIPVRWSADGTQQAFDVRLEVDSSVADGVFSFGGESFSNGPTQPDGGSFGGTVNVDGGLEANAILAVLLAGAWLAAHKLPDNVVVFGVGASSGITVPIGRPIEGAVGQTLMTILGTVGRGQYRITGRPYEYVFQEITALAQVEGYEDAERSTVRIENHLVNSSALAQAIAVRVLGRLRAQQNARAVTMVHDLALEPDDVFRVGSGTAARSYMIRSIRRTLERGGELRAELDCFEITQGVRP